MWVDLLRYEARFWAKVQVGVGCWPWIGARNNGYGVMRVRGDQGAKNVLATHFMVALVLDEWPADLGLCALHRCDNPPCVNPAHLFLGDHRANALDMFAKGRAYDRRGALNPRSLIDEATAGAVLALHADGFLQREIAAYYGVRRTLVADITSGRSWRHLARA